MDKNFTALSPGTVIHGPERIYTIVSVLGQGGFGITYLVKSQVRIGNIVMDAKFALKEHFISSLCSRDGATMEVIYSEPVSAEVNGSMRAFMKEARRMQSLGLDHDNIVRINEVFEDNNTAYYVMEYLGGETLEHYVKTHGVLTLEETRRMLGPVIEAVAMLHENNVAHYDIKPGNIMIQTGEDGSVRPVLIDFGLAKHYDKQGHATSTIAAAGFTPGYAPVEQYGGIKDFSPRCDIYALAASVYFCLTGKAPSTAFELQVDEVERELSAVVGESVARGISRALAMVSSQRTGTVHELMQDVFGEGNRLNRVNQSTAAGHMRPTVLSHIEEPTVKIQAEKGSHRLSGLRNRGWIMPAVIATVAVAVGLQIGRYGPYMIAYWLGSSSANVACYALWWPFLVLLGLTFVIPLIKKWKYRCVFGGLAVGIICMMPHHRHYYNDVYYNNGVGLIDADKFYGIANMFGDEVFAPEYIAVYYNNIGGIIAVKRESSDTYEALIIKDYDKIETRITLVVDQSDKSLPKANEICRDYLGTGYIHTHLLGYDDIMKMPVSAYGINGGPLMYLNSEADAVATNADQVPAADENK